jgi:glycerol uptake facilitator-like aquaporin
VNAPLGRRVAAEAVGTGLLITLLGPVSGAHFNPAVTLVTWFTGRRTPDGLGLRDLAAYVAAQIVGAIGGAILATAGLIALILGLNRVGRAALAPGAVAAYIGAAYWFTSSRSFANPAVTVGRAFTDTFAGIAPDSVAPFIAAQLLGAVLGLGAGAVLYGRSGTRSSGAYAVCWPSSASRRWKHDPLAERPVGTGRGAGTTRFPDRGSIAL